MFQVKPTTYKVYISKRKDRLSRSAEVSDAVAQQKRLQADRLLN